MDNFDKKWKQRFEEKTSSNNPILQMSEDVFGKVKESMFPKKKKRKGLIIWILSGFGLFIFLTVLWGVYSGIGQSEYNENNYLKVIDTSDEELEKRLSEIKPETINSRKTGVQQTKNVVSENSIEYSNSISPTAPKENSRTYDASLSYNKNNNKISTLDISEALISDNQTISKKELFSPKDQFDKSHILGTSDHLKLMDDLFVSHESTPEQKKNSKRLNQISTLNHQAAHSKTITPSIPVQKLTLFDVLPHAVKLSSVPHISVRHKSAKNVSWQLESRIEYVSWHDRLGSNYAAILNPADFYSSQKSGYGISVGVVRDFNSRLSVSVGGRIQHIKSQSGHNSAVLYDVNDEVDPLHNTTEMTLGTPYGLLKSEVEFMRSGTLSENREMQIDVQTSHQFNAFSLYGDMRFACIQKPTWRFDIIVGPELVFLSNINNRVSYGILNTNDIAITDNHLVNSQQFIKPMVLAVRGGVQANKSLSPAWKLIVGGDWTEGLTPTFENNGLGSYSRKYSAHIGLNMLIH